MELNSSAITGAMKIGVQVIVARKRPVLEIYQHLRNQFGPEEHHDLPTSSSGRKTQTHVTRLHDISVDLTLVNIGGERAENVTFVVDGGFRRSSLRDQHPKIFSKVVRQISPGQGLLLMKIDRFDMLDYSYSVIGRQKVGNPAGVTQETLSITVHYDGPNTLVNRLLRLWRHLRGHKQFSTEFLFDPEIFDGDLPSPKYA